jgi:regulator of sigma E protease
LRVSFGPLDILLIIVGISILVIVHESGHYLAARAFKMRVLRYSIGFGPTLFKYQPKGSPTVFQVAAIPFLAYVQIAGMNPHEDVDPKDPGLFGNKSVFARVVTIAAGPFANYLCASLLVFLIGLSGWPQLWLRVLTPDDPRATAPASGPMVVGDVLEGVAQDAGVAPGDVFVEANGRTIHDVRDLIEVTAPRGGQATTYVIERDGERRTIEMTPARGEDGVGRIGVAAEPVYVKFELGEAARSAITFPWRLTLMQLQGMAKMVQEADTSQIGGPVAMGKMIGDAAQSGPTDFFAVLALLSTALGLFNLLPLPALDGGRLAFLGYELITRRRANEKLEAVVHTVGIVFLLCVIVLVTIRDIFGGPSAPEEAATQSTRTSTDGTAPSEAASPSAMDAPTAATPSGGTPSTGTPTTGTPTTPALATPSEDAPNTDAPSAPAANAPSAGTSSAPAANAPSAGTPSTPATNGPSAGTSMHAAE